MNGESEGCGCANQGCAQVDTLTDVQQSYIRKTLTNQKLSVALQWLARNGITPFDENQFWVRCSSGRGFDITLDIKDGVVIGVSYG